MTGFAVEFEGVHKWFGDLHVLDDVNLQIANGERIVICGPSGSGKSTLIRCVNQLEQHDKGEIRVAGAKVVRGDERGAADVGMVFQSFNLFPHLTVLENCTLAPRLVRKLGVEQAERVALEHLSRVRVADQARKHPGELSGGQQQRAAIARALAMSPKILLLDEPTSALDAEMVREVLDVMVELANDGRTMICVTHEMGFARQVADRVVFMDAGRVVEVQATVDFFERPQQERTRQFLSQLMS